MSEPTPASGPDPTPHPSDTTDARTGAVPAPRTDPDGPGADDVRAVQRTWFTEDWLATAVGLVLVVLVLSGVITKGLVP